MVFCIIDDALGSRHVIDMRRRKEGRGEEGEVGEKEIDGEGGEGEEDEWGEEEGEEKEEEDFFIILLFTYIISIKINKLLK